MIHPTIHLNGTGVDDLLEGWNRAYQAVLDAERAFRNTAPNGRDYYPQGPNAINTALDEYGYRLEKLQQVRRDIDALRNHLMFPEEAE